MRRSLILVLVSSLLPLAALATTWDQHEIDARYRGANALSPGDANADGRTDYVTNYEFDQRVAIALHPGDGDVQRAWPVIDAWAAPRSPSAGVNPEHAVLADLDGDGATDIVVAQGYSSFTSYDGSSPGVRVLWGRLAGRPDAGWDDGGRVPCTVDAGHFLYVQTHDLDGDGRLEVIAGGRVHAGTGAKTGLVWLDPAPGDPRDLARWVRRPIDAEQWSGHGLLLEDVDEDGDLDIALANADWDTPEAEEEVVWYENPGLGAVASAPVWDKHVIYRGAEFFAKPQLAAADLDGDGRRDLVTQVCDAFYWFRKTSTAPVAWERVVVTKDPVAQWLGRGVRVADMNGDGRLDLVGALVHDAGLLPAEKAALFWMEPLGAPGGDPWTTHVVKWGSGRTMLIPVFGEKWDQLDVTDVDADGDLDLVANCEEWWEDGGVMAPFYDPAALPAVVAVAWFENPLGETRRLSSERDGACAFEAEHASELRDGTWVGRDGGPGASGSGVLVDANIIATSPRAWSDTAGAVYDVALAGGVYDLWVRLRAPSRWGPFLGGPRSDSLWISIDGQDPRVAGDVGADDWTWVRAVASRTLAAGRHQILLRTREGGCIVDRLIVQTADLAAP